MRCHGYRHPLGQHKPARCKFKAKRFFLVPSGRIVVGWCGDVDCSGPAWSRMAAEITAAEYEVWRIQVA